MIKRLFPTYFYESINHIDYDLLFKKGYRTLFFDLDNTIAPFDVDEPTKDIIEFIIKLKGKGFNVCIVSNNSVSRVDTFVKNLDVKSVGKAKKPFKKNILKAINIMQSDKNSTILIGDQMFTDVFVANRVGIASILVLPVSTRDEFTVKLKRGVEKVVFNLYIRSIR